VRFRCPAFALGALIGFRAIGVRIVDSQSVVIFNASQLTCCPEADTRPDGAVPGTGGPDGLDGGP
jgi:hypothetical protein